MAAIEKFTVDKDGTYNFILVIKEFKNGASQLYTKKIYLDQSTEWSIKIYPNGANSKNTGYVSIFLCSDNKTRPTIKVFFSCSVIRSSDTSNSESMTHYFKSGEDFGWPRYSLKKDIYTYKRKLTLSFKFNLILVKFDLTSIPKDPAYSLKPGIRQKLFTDVTVKVQGKEIKAHKLYLAEASEKFLEMLSKDPNENVLELKDLEFEIAEKIIQFIYEDQIEGIENSARVFLTVADEYKMDRLKKYCQKSVCESLTVENVFEILEFSTNHDYQELKMECIEFMAHHISEIPKPDWTDFIRDSSILFNKLFKHCVQLHGQKIYDKFQSKSACSYGFSDRSRRRYSDHDFKYLYLDEKFSDVKLKIGRRVLKAHKSVLSSRSTVFKAMFEHDTKESQENRVIIMDYDLITMEELLRYIYCGKVNNLQKCALQLLPAADYYNLPDLVKICEESIVKFLEIGDFPEVCEIADLFNIPELKAEAMAFFGRKVFEHMESEGWRKLMKRNAEFFNKIFVDWIKEFFKK